MSAGGGVSPGSPVWDIVTGTSSSNQRKSWEEFAGLKSDYKGIAKDRFGQDVNIQDPSGHYGVGFGGGDYRKARQSGYSALSIMDHLKSIGAGPDSTNMPVGMAAWNDLISDAAIERTQKAAYKSRMDWQDRMQGMLADYDKRLTDWTTKQEKSQEDYQRQSLANQMRVSTPTHVKQPSSPLAIGPSRVAMPQSAGSLARKPRTDKPVVTGLNIGNVLI